MGNKLLMRINRLAEAYRYAEATTCVAKACFESLMEIWRDKTDRDIEDFIAHFQGVKGGK
jgi:hypothetical protein